MLRFLRSLVAVALAATPLSAQSDVLDSSRRALETITEGDFATKLAALAHDSTRGRETPSPELARATEWVALQFDRAGLTPAGDDGGYLQAFRLRQERLDSLTNLTITAAGTTSRWTLGADLAYVGGATRPSCVTFRSYSPSAFRKTVRRPSPTPRSAEPRSSTSSGPTS